MTESLCQNRFASFYTLENHLILRCHGEISMLLVLISQRTDLCYPDDKAHQSYYSAFLECLF